MKKRINVTIDETTLYYLDGLAYERGVDRSTMITLLVRLNVLQRNYPESILNLESLHDVKEI